MRSHSPVRWHITCAMLSGALASTHCALDLAPPAQAEQPAATDQADAAVDDLAHAMADAGPAVDGSAADRGLAGETDAGVATPDAGPRPPYAGTPSTLEIATWNLKNFPTEPGVSEQLLATSILAMDYDIVAVEEIADVDAFAATLALLPGYASVVSSDTYWNGTYQKTGIIYRTDVVTVNRAVNLFDSDDAFPRPPLRLDLRLTLAGAGAAGDALDKDLALVVVHLKAGTGNDDSAKRRAAVEHLETYIATDREAAPERDLLVVGDFNARLVDDEGAELWPLYDDGAFLTRPLETAGDVSYLPYPKLIDHLFAVDRGALDLASQQTLVVPLHDQIADYTHMMSDHLPVAAFFALQEP